MIGKKLGGLNLKIVKVLRFFFVNFPTETGSAQNPCNDQVVRTT